MNSHRPPGLYFWPRRAYLLRVVRRPYALSCPLSADERTAIDLLKGAAALGADADLARLAFWRLSEHYDLRLPLETFQIGDRSLRRRAPVRSRRKATKTA